MSDERPTSRPAASREDMLAIYAALQTMQAEISRAPVNEPKALTGIAAVIRAGHARIVEINGKIIGTWGFNLTDWWFSDESAFFSKWFYVDMQHRYSEVTRVLLEDVSDMVEEAGIPAYIHVYEGGRGVSVVRKIGIELGFQPTGRIMIVEPRGDA